MLNTATEVLPMATAKLGEEEEEAQVEEKTLELFMQKKPNRTMLETDYRKAAKMHDELLVKREVY